MHNTGLSGTGCRDRPPQTSAYEHGMHAHHTILYQSLSPTTTNMRA